MNQKIPAKKVSKDPKIIRWIVENIRLTWALFNSSEISTKRKFAFVAIAVAWFFLSPLGVWNDLAMGLGVPDDVGFIVLWSWVFNETCPKAIVMAIREKLGFEG